MDPVSPGQQGDVDPPIYEEESVMSRAELPQVTAHTDEIFGVSVLVAKHDGDRPRGPESQEARARPKRVAGREGRGDGEEAGRPPQSVGPFIRAPITPSSGLEAVA